MQKSVSTEGFSYAASSANSVFSGKQTLFLQAYYTNASFMHPRHSAFTPMNRNQVIKLARHIG